VHPAPDAVPTRTLLLTNQEAKENGSATVNMAEPSPSHDRSLWGAEAAGRRDVP
jgi:hypothetical protein